VRLAIIDRPTGLCFTRLKKGIDTLLGINANKDSKKNKREKGIKKPLAKVGRARG